MHVCPDWCTQYSQMCGLRKNELNVGVFRCIMGSVSSGLSSCVFIASSFSAPLTLPADPALQPSPLLSLHLAVSVRSGFFFWPLSPKLATLLHTCPAGGWTG